MTNKKKVVFISFYDRICVSTRALSSVIKKAGHRPFLLYFKDDRVVVKDTLSTDNKYYQIISNNLFTGCGEDVNPPTELEFKLLVNKIVEINPDIVCVSARSIAKELSKKVVTSLRSVLPNAIYVGGGYGPTIEPEKFLEFLDFVCLGEGEQAILDIVTTDDLKKVDNLAWLENGKLQHNKLAKVSVLDELPYPDWEFEDKFMIEDDKISPIKDVYDTKTYDIYASRGCPSNCTYCIACHWDKMYSKYNGFIPKIRLKTVNSVINELLVAKKKHDLKYVRFMDSIFGFNKKWLFEFLDRYDKEIGLKFFCYLDERFIDEERIKRLKDSGFSTTTVGIQSTTEEIRFNIMGRNVSDDGLVKYAETLINNGIKIKYDLIGWNPFETNETLRRGVDFLKRLPKGKLTVVFQLKMFPGSPIHSMFQEKNPKSLTNKEHEYWAWIYQMIISSKKSEEIADFALKYDYFKENPDVLRELFNEIRDKEKTKEKLFAARDIRKGEIITTVMFERKETESKDGILYIKSSEILNKALRRDIKKGEMLEWKDFFGAYQNVGRGKF